MLSLYGLLSEIVFSAARPFLNRKYSEGNEQRYGYYSDAIPAGGLWVHAVSVGEIQSASSFIRTIQKDEPTRRILLSTITQTGRLMSEQLLNKDVTRIYYPWDAPSVLKRALDTLRPSAYVTVETEIWPGILDQLQRRNIPAFLINARLSEPSFQKYLHFKSFCSKSIRSFALILARTQDERQRFIELGADQDKVCVTGDCKVDALIERKNEIDMTSMKKYFPGDRQTILAGSTHEGEEEIVLSAYISLLDQYPGLRLLVAPRHPERAKGVVELVRLRGIQKVALMSEEPKEWNVLVVDKIGFLFQMYGCVQAAFLGGSLVPKGGQNIMEPAIWEIPCCQGPDFHDFTEVGNALVAEGACRIVHNSEEMQRYFSEALSGSLTQQCSAASRRFFAKSGGASTRNWDLIKDCLSRR